MAAPMRFGLIDFASSGSDAWRARAQRAEQLGFDVLWTGDHLFHFARPETPFLDGWVLLSAWTAVTSRIRLGMLVANLSWRSPVLVARAAVAVDQLSGGRLELGLGVGAFADQAMAAVLEMSAGERIGRLREGTQVLDRLLRGDLSPFAGTYTSYAVAGVAPGCVQVPRPPLTLAANGPRALGVVAELADAWSTWGGLELPVGEFRAATAARARTLEAHCKRPVDPPAGHLHIRLINMPAISDPLPAEPGRIGQQRAEPLHPPVHADVVDVRVMLPEPLRRHLVEILNLEVDLGSGEVITDRAPAYPRVLDELWPAAWHHTERYANNRIEAGHAQLKRRLRAMRGVKTMSGLRVVAAGHAFVQNLRRGHYKIATDEPAGCRLAVAFVDLARAV